MANDAARKLGDLLGSVFGGLFDQPAVRLGLAAIGGYVVVLWLASAWWAFHDSRRRSVEPAAPYLAAGLVVLATPLLFPLALLVYAVLRPGRTLAESRLIRLEHEVEAGESDLASVCPTCARLVDEAWLSCPSCRTRLAYACRGCGRPVGLDWSLCAWCGTAFGGSRLVVPTVGPASAGPSGIVATSELVDRRRRRWAEPEPGRHDRRGRRSGEGDAGGRRIERPASLAGGRRRRLERTHAEP